MRTRYLDHHSYKFVRDMVALVLPDTIQETRRYPNMAATNNLGWADDSLPRSSTLAEALRPNPVAHLSPNTVTTLACLHRD
jgi:hypothetical protein